MILGIRRKALLTLGAIAKTLKNELPQASMNIIQYLHDSLNKTTSLEQDSILIDSIGNAGDEISQNILHKFAKNNARINIQHTAIRALRHHHDYEVRSGIIVEIYSVLLDCSTAGRVSRNVYQ